MMVLGWVYDDDDGGGVADGDPRSFQTETSPVASPVKKSPSVPI